MSARVLSRERGVVIACDNGALAKSKSSCERTHYTAVVRVDVNRVEAAKAGWIRGGGWPARRVEQAVRLLPLARGAGARANESRGGEEGREEARARRGAEGQARGEGGGRGGCSRERGGVAVTALRITLVAMLAGCVHVGIVDRATLGLSAATLACDWMQTRGEAAGGWSRWQEANAMLGHTPSVARVDAYFAAAELLNVALWAALPDGWRSVVPVAVGGLEVQTVAGNAPRTGMCR